MTCRSCPVAFPYRPRPAPRRGRERLGKHLRSLSPQRHPQIVHRQLFRITSHSPAIPVFRDFSPLSPLLPDIQAKPRCHCLHAHWAVKRSNPEVHGNHRRCPALPSLTLRQRLSLAIDPADAGGLPGAPSPTTASCKSPSGCSLTFIISWLPTTSNRSHRNHVPRKDRKGLEKPMRLRSSPPV